MMRTAKGNVPRTISFHRTGISSAILYGLVPTISIKVHWVSATHQISGILIISFVGQMKVPGLNQKVMVFSVPSGLRIKVFTTPSNRMVVESSVAPGAQIVSPFSFVTMWQ